MLLGLQVLILVYIPVYVTRASLLLSFSKNPLFFYLLHAETAILKEKIAFLEAQLAQAEKREEWLKGQVETAQETIKLLDHKQLPKKGLFGRLLGAINQE